MRCTKCGKEIPDESVYCMWCGEKVLVPNRYPSTEMEKWYEDIMRNHVAAIMKNPAECEWPRYDESMRSTHGVGKKPYVDTYIDATNSYGGRLRVRVRIKMAKYPEYSGFGLKEPNQSMYVTHR